MLINPGDTLSPGKLEYAWRFGVFKLCPIHPFPLQFVSACLKRQETPAAPMCHDCEMGRKVKESMHGMTVYKLQKLAGR